MNPHFNTFNNYVYILVKRKCVYLPAAFSWISITDVRNIHAFATDSVDITWSSHAAFSSSTPTSCARVIISNTRESLSVICN